jgi:two-component system, OmpR family, sensor histidine kinase KdpD
VSRWGTLNARCPIGQMNSKMKFERTMNTTVNSPKAKLLVCVGASPSAVRLIRSVNEMAARLHAEWYAVHVATPKRLMSPEVDSGRAVDNLMLAELAGARTATLRGRNVAEEVVGFAQQRGVTDIIVGRPRRSVLESLLRRSPVDQLLRISGDINVHVIPGEATGSGALPARSIPLADYGSAVLFLIIATVLCFAMFPFFDLSNLIMVYLLAVLVTATGCGRGPAVLVSVLSVLAFDFYFVPPRYSFTVDEAQYIVTFVVMLVVALVISHLAARLRQEAETARLQEQQAEAMHGLSRQLASTRGTESILKTAEQYLSEIFNCRVVALLPDETGKLTVAARDPASVIQNDMVKEINLAQSVYATGRMSGWGIQGSPTVEILCIPLQAAHARLGVLVLRPNDLKRPLLPRQLNLLESLSKQVALSLEVEHLAGRCVTQNEPLKSAS